MAYAENSLFKMKRSKFNSWILVALLFSCLISSLRCNSLFSKEAWTKIPVFARLREFDLLIVSVADVSLTRHNRAM